MENKYFYVTESVGHQQTFSHLEMIVLTTLLKHRSWEILFTDFCLFSQFMKWCRIYAEEYLLTTDEMKLITKHFSKLKEIQLKVHWWQEQNAVKDHVRVKIVCTVWPQTLVRPPDFRFGHQTSRPDSCLQIPVLRFSIQAYNEARWCPMHLLSSLYGTWNHLINWKIIDCHHFDIRIANFVLNGHFRSLMVKVC